MLTKVEVDNLQGKTLSLPLDDISGGYVIKDIAGLDPVKATISTSAFAQLDGATFQGARREMRNILMKLGIEPDYATTSVAALRQSLFSFFMPKTDVLLRFYMDNVLHSTIQGKVESCEAPPFSQDPELVASILCMDPNFKHPSTISYLSTVTTATTSEYNLNISGTVETGYVFTLNVNRSISGFTIYNRRPDGTVRQMDVTLALVAGDVVKISTEPRNKYATLTRGGVTTSILYAVSPTSNWAPFNPGYNYYRVLVSGAAIPYTLVYTPRYGGL
jgi:hypothetical protein